MHVLLTIFCGTCRKNLSLIAWKLKKPLHFESVKKWKLRNIGLKTPLTRYLNGTEIYIWPDKWLYNSDRGLKLHRIVDLVCRLNLSNKKKKWFLTIAPPYISFESTAVGQAAACASVTQRARVRSPAGTSFLGEVFSGIFLTFKTNVGKL